jgi:hypothetical protein
MSLPLAFTTAGDAAGGLLFGWDISTLQQGALVYLAVSLLGFAAVWLIGLVRRS